MFSAACSRGLLVVIQGIDAAGKDGIIKHVMSGLNPQGVNVYPFREPTPVERRHDFLWRAACSTPERGRIAIFNRSYYEEVLVVRVEPAVLALENLPPEPAGDNFWAERYRAINDFERYLVGNGTTVVKFMLHLSREQELKRILKRIERPEKRWKFSHNDLEVPKKWDAYRSAYEAMLSNTSTVDAPWYMIPADRKWVARLAVARILVEHLSSMQLAYPQPTPADAALQSEAEKFVRAELDKRSGGGDE